jgi:hypothetical protein
MVQTRSRPRSIRRDGWTVERQLGFLAELARTRSVARAANAVGMSREGAYRLRSRPGSALFGALWDHALRGHQAEHSESHAQSLTDGQLMRLLGMHFRREAGHFRAICRSGANAAAGNRTRTS